MHNTLYNVGEWEGDLEEVCLITDLILLEI